MYRSMVDIQSAAAEIRREKKRKKKQDKNIMSTFATQGGHNNGTSKRGVSCLLGKNKDGKVTGAQD